eukprot:jgi/Ulvmu1/12317/UM089_0001.1
MCTLKSQGARQLVVLKYGTFRRGNMYAVSICGALPQDLTAFPQDLANSRALIGQARKQTVRKCAIRSWLALELTAGLVGAVGGIGTGGVGGARCKAYQSQWPIAETEQHMPP